MNFRQLKEIKRAINDLVRNLGVNFFAKSDCLAIDIDINSSIFY